MKVPYTAGKPAFQKRIQFFVLVFPIPLQYWTLFVIKKGAIITIFKKGYKYLK